jgi:hypothetical protein
MLLMLPALIAETGLLSFISRHHLDKSDRRSPLMEAPLKDTAMRRCLGGHPSAEQLFVTCHATAHLALEGGWAVDSLSFPSATGRRGCDGEWTAPTD